jgi:FkbM family methyltransferase
MLAHPLRTAAFILGHPLGRRQPLHCVLRYLRWQVVSRTRSGPQLVRFVNDTCLWARAGETGVTGNIYVGLHEFADMAFVAHLLRPGDVFGDIGANAGTYTVLASGVAGARTLAVEPAPDAAQRLRANVALNNIASLVDVETCAVGAAIGTARFTTTLDTMNHVLADHEDDTSSMGITIKTIDEMFLARGNKPILLKIDIEGYEREALRGAEETVSDPSLQAIIIETSASSSECVGRVMTRHGFTNVRYAPFDRCLSRHSEGDRLCNQLYVRSPDFICERTRSAAAFTVHRCRI